ncbi:MAG: glycosyltransferase family 2 protein [Pseudorhodobacter sp.]
MALTKHISPHGTVMAVSMMKDEAPYLLEWFAHHLAVGFTDILVYTNDCSDGTVEMLQRLEALGLGHHRPNNIPDGAKPQPSALNHAQKEPLVSAADWLMVFDADEFLSINHPSGHLDGMLADVVAQGANGIVVTWRIFGSSSIVEWSREPVTETFTRAAPPLWNKGWGVKTLFKYDPDFWKLGIHRPAIKNKHLEGDFPASVHWLNGSGAVMEDYFKFRGWRSIRRTLGYDWAQMNHYAVKSIEAYAIRKFRGNVNNKADKYNADYWALQDRNEVPDTQILHHVPRRAAIMAELLRDPMLRELHEAAQERVEARLAEFRQTEAYITLRDGLIAAGKVPITEVEAKPPQARDPAKIAALMSRVEKKAQAKSKIRADTAPISGWNAVGVTHYVPGPVDLSAELDIEWVNNQGFDLPADARIFTAETVMAVLAGKFDRRNARNISLYLRDAARVLDIGGGIGLPAMKALRENPDLVVMLHEARPGLAAAAEMIQRHNGLADSSRLKLVNGPLQFEGDDLAKAGGLMAYLHDFRADTLRITNFGNLPPALLATVPTERLRRIVIPVETKAEPVRAAFGPVLTGLGFNEDHDAANGGSLLFLR